MKLNCLLSASYFSSVCTNVPPFPLLTSFLLQYTSAYSCLSHLSLRLIYYYHKSLLWPLFHSPPSSCLLTPNVQVPIKILPLALLRELTFTKITGSANPQPHIRHLRCQFQNPMLPCSQLVKHLANYQINQQQVRNISASQGGRVSPK